MTINNPEVYMNNIWDWAILDGCFGDTRIKPTDIEGFVERNGQFLVIECKSPGVQVPIGQQITFYNLIKTGVFTVLIVWGKANEPEELQFWSKRKMKADLNKFREMVGRWFEFANNKRR